jgi:hypothetical protein
MAVADAPGVAFLFDRRTERIQGVLGWNTSVFRQADGGSLLARADSEKGASVAIWQTGVWGLRWIDELVETGQAIDLGGNGYPRCYTAQAEYLIPSIIDSPQRRTAPGCTPSTTLSHRSGRAGRRSTGSQPTAADPTSGC